MSLPDHNIIHSSKTQGKENGGPPALFKLPRLLSPALFVQSIRFLLSGASENLPKIHFFSLASFPDSW